MEILGNKKNVRLTTICFEAHNLIFISEILRKRYDGVVALFPCQLLVLALWPPVMMCYSPLFFSPFMGVKIFL